MIRLADIEGDQALYSLVPLFRHHCSNIHTGQPGKSMFNLSKFNAETPQLDLMVGSPEVFDNAVGPVTGKISCSIHTCVRIFGKWIRNKFLGGQIRTFPVPTGKSVTANEQFSRDTHGNRVKGFVQNIQKSVANGESNGLCGCTGGIRYLMQG